MGDRPAFAPFSSRRCWRSRHPRTENSARHGPAGTTRNTRPCALSVSRYTAPSGPARTSRMRSPSSLNNTSCGPGAPVLPIGTRRTLRSASAATSRLPRQAGNIAPSYQASPAGAMEGVHSVSGGVMPGRLR